MHGPFGVAPRDLANPAASQDKAGCRSITVERYFNGVVVIPMRTAQPVRTSADKHAGESAESC